MDVVGLSITPEILSNIDSCDAFACDLTTLNLNVLFELGYAVAKRKKIWITLNVELDGAIHSYESFRILKNIGHFRYSNASDLLKEFYELQIYREDRLSLAQQRSLFIEKDYVDVFALKAQSRLDTINAPIEILRASKLKPVIDDVEESAFYPIDWYCKNIYSSYGVYLQFMGDEQPSRENHNFKAALLAGIALGLEKYTLFVCQAPFKIPSDLPDLIHTFTNIKQSKKLVVDWVSDLVAIKNDREIRRQNYEESSARLAKLGLIRLGEIVAENEADNLPYYFIPTAAYNEIIFGTQSIYVGRKGTGKSANLLAAQKHFGSEKTNLIILFNPVGYEIESVMQLLASMQDSSRRGFFTDALWKYLIYTEIAETLTKKFRQIPDINPDKDEAALIEFINRNPYVVSESFSERISYVMDMIKIEITKYPTKDVRENISSVLYSQLISMLKKLLMPLLEKFNQLVILVDNLDKGWTTESDTRAISDILFSLISLTKHLPAEIIRELRASSTIKIKMTIFLRSDIYSIMQEHARERDKLVVQKVEWNNSEMLGRILDRRIVYTSGITSPVDAWREFFETKNDGDDIKTFIIEHTRPRPRDVIVLITNAIGSAVNSGHPKVQISDLNSGLQSYSNWVYDSLLEEDDPARNLLDKIVDKFIDERMVYGEEEISNLLKSVCSNTKDVEYYFNLLCDANFLEIEAPSGDFIVVSDSSERIRTLKLARIRAEKADRDVKFRINKPFRISLGIE